MAGMSAEMYDRTLWRISVWGREAGGKCCSILDPADWIWMMCAIRLPLFCRCPARTEAGRGGGCFYAMNHLMKANMYGGNNEHVKPMRMIC